MQKVALLLFTIIPTQAMFVLKSRSESKAALQPTPARLYERGLAKTIALRNKRIQPKTDASTKQRLIQQQNVALYSKDLKIEKLKEAAPHWSWGALLAALGLEWLWQSEENAKKEKDALLKRCQQPWRDPLYEYAQFISNYTSGAVAEKLFQEMIADDVILWNMWIKTTEKNRFLLLLSLL